MCISLTARMVSRVTWRVSASVMICCAILGALYVTQFELHSRQGTRSMKTHMTQALAEPASLCQRKSNADPIVLRCPMYREFRCLDFLQASLRRKLCRNAEAYKRYHDGFPMCLLPDPFDADLLQVARDGSEVVRLTDVHNGTVRLFVYRWNDYISDTIRITHAWEPKFVHWTLMFALKLPDVTFLDIGSNVGVYSMQAAKLGLPVVAVDANIRNLLRLRLSLNAASLDATLVWNYIASEEQLKYIYFPASCNVGGAGSKAIGLPDTVPVMPLRSERLASLIRTKTVVMKLDLESGEAEFLRTSGSLFADFHIAAVQMEFWTSRLHPREADFIVSFFVEHDYVSWKVPEFRRLNPDLKRQWGDIDVMWVRRDNVRLMNVV